MPHPGSTAERGPINLYDPVNRNHPLNRGRVAWWLTLPGLEGGNTWYDLAGRHHGTLTGMGNSTNGWRPTTRPGGWGHVLFAGGSSSVSVADAPELGLASNFAYAAWASFTSVATWASLLNKGGGGSWGGQDYVLGLNASGFFEGRLAGTSVAATTPTPQAATWYRFLVIAAGTTGRIYVNGLPAGTAAITPATTNTNPLVLGNDSGSDAFLGAMDDVAVWSGNPLSLASPDAFAAADYDLSRRGYPGVLNRI